MMKNMSGELITGPGDRDTTAAPSNNRQSFASAAGHEADEFGREDAPSGAGLLRHVTRWQIVLFAKLFDFATIILVAMIVFVINIPPGQNLAARYVAAAVTVGLACYVSFLNARLYDIDILIESARVMKPLSINWTVVFTALAATLSLVHRPDLFSRLWFTEFYTGGLVALGFERWSVERLIRAWVRQGHDTKSVAIVGANELAIQLIDRLRHNRTGIRVIGVFDDRRGEAPERVAPIKRLGTIADLLDYGRTHSLDLVVVTLPLAAADRIATVIKTLREQPFTVRILPGEVGLQMLSPIRLPRSELPGVQLIAVMDRPISEVALFMKSAIDVIGALALCILLSPVLLACALGILLCDGRPVFFSQMRIGYKARPFKIFKFRTMRMDHGSVAGLTQRGDPRVFRFGHLLRRTSLDEFPQLLNVLKGEMSLIGPRPHLPTARAAGKLYFDAVIEYAARHRVKPGITGWAQVNGWRGPTDTIEQIERRVEHDIYYIENWSLYFDLIILVRTIVSGFWGKNAF
jgi:Undecaprenyl-phosphate glucose phosphotransferase